MADRNVQTIVPEKAHKALVDEAYEKKIPLKDLIRAILVTHTERKENPNERTP